MNPHALKGQCLCVLVTLLFLCSAGSQLAQAQRKGGKSARAKVVPSRGSAATGAEDSRVTKLLDEGFDYAESAKWDEAIRSYSQAVGISPRNAEGYIGMGDAYMRAGKYKEGFAAYQQAVRVAPWNADAHYSLGAAHNDMAQYGDAFKPFVEAIRLDPDFAEAYFGIGFAYQWLQNYKDALGYLKKAIRLKPDYAEAHLSLGLTYHGLHNAKAAAEQLRILEAMNASLAKELEKELHAGGTKNAATAVAQNQTQSSEDERESPVATGRPATTEAAKVQTPARAQANVRRQTTGVAPAQKRTEQAGDAASLLAVELSFWDSIKNSDDPEEFAAYLRKYPDGQFAELARIRMRALESRKGAVAADVEQTQEVAKAQPTPAQMSPKPDVQEGPKASQEQAKPAQEEQPQPDGAAAIAGKESGELDSGATLDETLQWISKNFSNKFSYKYTTAAEDPNGTPTTTDANVNYEPLKFEGCRIDWRDNADTLSVSLAELDPTSVKIEPRSRPNTTFSIEVWNLSINASDGKGAIREIKGDGGAVNSYSGLDLQFDGRARAERLGRALQSAIKLCGAKP